MALLAKRNGNLFPSLTSSLFDTDRFFNPKFFDLDKELVELSSRIPSVNISESDKDFKLELAAPGLDKNDLKVEVNKGLLTISCEKEEEKNEEKKNYKRREYSYNSFSRSFQLPENVVTEKIEAKYENGVLNVTLPKKEVTVTPASKEIKVS